MYEIQMKKKTNTKYMKDALAVGFLILGEAR